MAASAMNKTLAPSEATLKPVTITNAVPIRIGYAQCPVRTRLLAGRE